MEAHEPETAGSDAADLQSEVGSLPGVRAVRVVSTPAGRISEVHVVADGSKSAKQLVRDVQTLALARLGLNIDYRIVSVVHLGDEDMPAYPTPARIRSIRWTTEGGRATCSVAVDVDGDETTGEAQGGASQTSRVRLPAIATIDALRIALELDEEVDLADVRVTDIAERRVAVVAIVRISESSEELVIGSALVGADEADAAARAVLDAFRRRLLQG